VHGVLGLGLGRLEVQPLDHRPHHHALLGHCERGPEAAADAATERDPLVGARLVTLPALRPEGERILVDVVAVVQQQDADRDRCPGGNPVVPELPRHRHAAADHRDDGAAAHAFVDRRFDLRVAVLVVADG
jgi:hypothetical protein